MFIILMTSLTDKPLILQWEVWLRSLLGYIATFFEDGLRVPQQYLLHFPKWFYHGMFFCREKVNQTWKIASTSPKCSFFLSKYLPRFSLMFQLGIYNYSDSHFTHQTVWLTTTDSFTRVVDIQLAFRQLIDAIIMPRVEKLITVSTCRKRQ